MSLKSQLNNLIKEKGYITYQEMIEFCVENGKKSSNGERRLRRSESPNIQAVMGKKKKGGLAIIGYKWVGEIPHKEDINSSNDVLERLGGIPAEQGQLFTLKRNFE
jgi:hypothetical protein